MPESNQKAMESAEDMAKGQGKKNMTDKFEERYVKKNESISYLNSSAHSINWLNKSLLSNHVQNQCPVAYWIPSWVFIK